MQPDGLAVGAQIAHRRCKQLNGAMCAQCAAAPYVEASRVHDYGTIGKCNKNFTEGSRIDFKACLYDDNDVTIPSNIANYYNCTTVYSVTA